MTFELPSGLPEGPWTAVRVSGGKWNHEVRDKNGEVVIIFAGEELARAIASIPDMVEEIRRLRKERDQFAEQAAARDQRDTDMQHIMGINNSLRALNAEMREVAKEVVEADTDFRAGMQADWEGDPLTDACEKLRAILAKSQEATP